MTSINTREVSFCQITSLYIKGKMMYNETMSSESQGLQAVNIQTAKSKNKNFRNWLIGISIVLNLLIPLYLFYGVMSGIEFDPFILTVPIVNITAVFLSWIYVSRRLKKEEKSMARLHFPRLIILLQTYIVALLIIATGSYVALLTSNCTDIGCMGVGLAMAFNFVVFCLVMSISLLMFMVRQRIVIQEGSSISGNYYEEIFTITLVLCVFLLWAIPDEGLFQPAIWIENLISKLN
jgi:hypothetical protein